MIGQLKNVRRFFYFLLLQPWLIFFCSKILSNDAMIIFGITVMGFSAFLIETISEKIEKKKDMKIQPALSETNLFRTADIMIDLWKTYCRQTSSPSFPRAASPQRSPISGSPVRDPVK